MATKPAEKKVSEDKALVDAIRNQPTDEQIAEARAAAKPDKNVYTVVKTTSGGSMWDPDEGQWIGGGETRAVRTVWLDRQIKAGKIEVVKEKD